MAVIDSLLPCLYILYYVPVTWSRCSNISATPRILGQYCKDVDAFALLFLLEHECTLTCAHKSTCAATNYNTVDNTCSMLPVTCSQTVIDPLMVYTVFTIDRGECLKLQNYSSSTVLGGRMAMTTDHENFLCLSADSGNIYPGYIMPSQRRCLATDGVNRFFCASGYPCQVLRVREGCTVAFVSYTAGDVLPHGAFAIKNPADGQLRYIAVLKTSFYFTAGYYTVGAPGAMFVHYGLRSKSTMEIMVVI